MDNQQFNQQPAPQYVAAPAQKKSLALPIVCAVLAVAGVGFGVFELLQNNNGKNVSDFKVSIEKADGTKTQIDADKIEIKDGDIILKEIAQGTSSIVETIIDEAYAQIYEERIVYDENSDVEEYNYLNFSTQYKEYPVTIKDEATGSLINLPDSISISANTNNTKKFATYKKIIETVLQENGLTKKDMIGSTGVPINDNTNNYSYFSSDGEVICNYDYYTLNDEDAKYNRVNRNNVLLTCTTRSQSSEKISLYKNLLEAYKEKEGKYPRFLGLSRGKLNLDGKLHFHAYFEDAAALFYRPDTSSSWKFFTGAQDNPPCSMYNTDDLKKAYHGERCYDEVTFEEKTVE